MGLGVFDFGIISKYGFDSSELPVVTIYPMYVPILVAMMIKERDLHPVKRFLLPGLSVLGVAVIVIASILKHGMANLWYLIVFAAIMGLGAIFYYRRKTSASEVSKDEK